MKEFFETVESSDFRFTANQAAGLRIFKQIVQEQEVFRLLQQQVLLEGRAQRVFFRILTLTSYDTDVRYESPYDTALATYLLALDSVSSSYAKQAAYLVLSTPRLWWSAKIAEEIVTRKVDKAGTTDHKYTAIITAKTGLKTCITQTKDLFSLGHVYPVFHWRILALDQINYCSESARGLKNNLGINVREETPELIDPVTIS